METRHLTLLSIIQHSGACPTVVLKQVSYSSCKHGNVRNHPNVVRRWRNDPNNGRRDKIGYSLIFGNRGEDWVVWSDDRHEAFVFYNVKYWNRTHTLLLKMLCLYTLTRIVYILHFIHT